MNIPLSGHYLPNGMYFQFYSIGVECEAYFSEALFCGFMKNRQRNKKMDFECGKGLPGYIFLRIIGKERLDYF